MFTFHGSAVISRDANYLFIFTIYKRDYKICEIARETVLLIFLYLARSIKGKDKSCINISRLHKKEHHWCK